MFDYSGCAATGAVIVKEAVGEPAAKDAVAVGKLPPGQSAANDPGG